jgi:hypothetical protein
MVLFFYTIREARRYPAPQMRAVRAYLSTSDIGAAPILSDNALFPAADGRPSWIIDVIMFRQLRVRDPRYARELESQVARSRFGAVVLEEDVRTEPGLAVLAYHFGDGFLPVFNRSYELVAQFPPYFVYRPRVRS